MSDLLFQLWCTNFSGSLCSRLMRTVVAKSQKPGFVRRNGPWLRMKSSVRRSKWSRGAFSLPEMLSISTVPVVCDNSVTTPRCQLTWLGSCLARTYEKTDRQSCFYARKSGDGTCWYTQIFFLNGQFSKKSNLTDQLSFVRSPPRNFLWWDLIATDPPRIACIPCTKDTYSTARPFKRTFCVLRIS